MTKCWIITEDGLTGTENQCLGIAEALGVHPVVKKIKLSEPWRSFTPWLGLENKMSFKGDLLKEPWPDLIISSGRKAIAAARYIKKESKGRTYSVFVQDPRISPHNFDLVVVPEHDPTRGKNVHVTIAAPNRITPEKLEQAREQFSSLLKPYTSPAVAVLIGGDTKKTQTDESQFQDLLKDLQDLQNKGFSLLITTSRRTPAPLVQQLHDQLANESTFITDGSSPNPYLGMLAHAEFILVTTDSTSMISDALSTGKPVYTKSIIPLSMRLQSFNKNLETSGFVRPFHGVLESYTYPPLNESEKIAKIIREQLKIK